MKLNNVRMSLFAALCLPRGGIRRARAICFRRGSLQKGHAQVTLERFGSEALLKGRVRCLAPLMAPSTWVLALGRSAFLLDRGERDYAGTTATTTQTEWMNKERS
jgi:hypothetical protein